MVTLLLLYHELPVHWQQDETKCFSWNRRKGRKRGDKGSSKWMPRKAPASVLVVTRYSYNLKRCLPVSVRRRNQHKKSTKRQKQFADQLLIAAKQATPPRLWLTKRLNANDVVSTWLTVDLSLFHSHYWITGVVCVHAFMRKCVAVLLCCCVNQRSFFSIWDTV